MSILPRHIVGTVRELSRWCKTAAVGEGVIYHAGEISVDRRKDDNINALADTVLLLAETGFVSCTQRRQYLYVEDVWAYWAIRARDGYAPRALIDGKLTSFEWRALKALRDRDADISATRAVRDALSFAMSSSDQSAEALLQGLKARRLVEEAPGKGWQLSKLGVGALT